MFSSAIRASTRVIPHFKPASGAVTMSRQFATYKSSTGLVGLAVDPKGRETIIDLSEQILKSVQKIPEGNGYRESVEQWFTYIHKVANKHEDIIDIEKEIDYGQIEELIEIAKEELELIDFYHAEKGWERVAAAHEEADRVKEEIADTLYFSDPKNHIRKV